MISKQKIIYSILEKYENLLQAYWSYTTRPMYSKTITRGTNGYSDASVAVVLQGPIINKNNFTYETLKLYVRRYPN